MSRKKILLDPTGPGQFPSLLGIIRYHIAPEVKTAFPISAKRLALKIKEIEAMG